MFSSSQVGSALVPGGADEAPSRELRTLKADFGPVVLGALEGPQAVEVPLNADGRLWQERLGQPMREIGAMPAWQAEALIRTVAAILRVVVTRENPIIEGELPGGSRIAGRLPPMVSAPRFAIRKRASCGLHARAARGSVHQRLVNGHEVEPLGFFFASLQAVAGALAVRFFPHASYSPLMR